MLSDMTHYFLSSLPTHLIGKAQTEIYKPFVFCLVGGGCFVFYFVICACHLHTKSCWLKLCPLLKYGALFLVLLIFRLWHNVFPQLNCCMLSHKQGIFSHHISLLSTNRFCLFFFFLVSLLCMCSHICIDFDAISILSLSF